MADLQGNTISATGAVSGATVNASSGVVYPRLTLTYGTTVNTDSSKADYFTLTVTDGVAFTIAAPSNPVTGNCITYTIRNTSGGAMGAITWNAVFKMAAFTTPATANQRSIRFVYDGTNWIELFKTAADVPN